MNFTQFRPACTPDETVNSQLLLSYASLLLLLLSRQLAHTSYFETSNASHLTANPNMPRGVQGHAQKKTKQTNKFSIFLSEVPDQRTADHIILRTILIQSVE